MGGQGSVDGAEDVGQGGTDASVHPMIAGIERSCDLVASTFGLSAKECEILKLIARGRSGASIAEEMVVSLNTIKTHVTHIYRKCGVHSREELLKLIESVNAA